MRCCWNKFSLSSSESFFVLVVKCSNCTCELLIYLLLVRLDLPISIVYRYIGMEGKRL